MAVETRPVYSIAYEGPDHEAHAVLKQNGLWQNPLVPSAYTMADSVEAWSMARSIGDVELLTSGVVAQRLASNQMAYWRVP